jgi:hypothetical protein
MSEVGNLRDLAAGFNRAAIAVADLERGTAQIRAAIGTAAKRFAHPRQSFVVTTDTGLTRRVEIW